MLDALGPSYSGQQASSDGASAGLPRPDRPPQRVGPRRRPQHRVPGGRRPRDRDERPRLGLQRRARARDDHRPADRRDAAPVRPHGRRPAGGVRRAPPRRHLRRRRPGRARLPRGERPAARTGGSTSATGSGCATTRRRSSTSATTPWSSPGWCSRSSPASTTDEIGGFRHSDTVVVTPDGIEILTSYPRDIESLTIPT